MRDKLECSFQLPKLHDVINNVYRNNIASYMLETKLNFTHKCVKLLNMKVKPIGILKTTNQLVGYLVKVHSTSSVL